MIKSICKECGKEIEYYAPRTFCCIECRYKYRAKHPVIPSDNIRRSFMHQNINRRPMTKSEVLATEGKRRSEQYARRKENLMEHSIIETMKKCF